MPIKLPYFIRNIPEEEFHNLDYTIMKLAFDTHNQLGRLHDEVVYKNEMTRQCTAAGIQIDQEVPIALTHKGYSTTLYIDLLIDRSTIYELKATRALTDAHRIQTLNYIFTTNTRHGKLINFRSSSVEYEFVSTHLNTEKRRNITILDSEWSLKTEATSLRDLTIDLLQDWGAYLDTGLYMDALTHFLRGKEHVLQPVTIYRETTPLGSKNLPLLSENEAFCLSSVNQNVSRYQTHLTRLLNHTKLTALHWINLNHSEIRFITLKK
jgi:GxxExxY protein